MSHSRIALVPYLVIALLFSSSSIASGQGALTDLPSGTRVRMIVPAGVKRKVVGTLASQGRDSLTIRVKADHELTIPLDEISTIDRSKGRNHAIGAVLGAVGGALVGVGLGVVCVSVCPKANSTDPNFAPLGGFVVGLPAGAVLGAVYGVERWKRVRFR